MSPTPLRLTVLAAALLAALGAHAQQLPAAGQSKEKKAAAKPAEAAEIQKVEIKGSADSYNPRRDDTASKMIVNHAEIIKYGDTNVVDVLKRLPGITIGGAGRGGNDIRMRGLGAGYTQILVNGERPPSGFSLENVAPELIERIEVLRSASAEYSTQSIAGTINVILKKTVAPRLQREVKLGLGVSDTSTNPSLNLQLSNQVGNMSYSLSGNAYYNKNRGQADTVEEEIDLAGRPLYARTTVSHSHGQNNGIGFGPRVSWTLDGGDTLTLQSFINLGRSSRRYANSSTFMANDPQPYSGYQGQGASQYNNLYNNVNWVHKGDKGSKLDLKLTAGLSSNDNQNRSLAFDRAGKLGYDTERNNESRGRNLSSTGKYSTPVVEGHALALGWDGGINTQHDEALGLREVARVGAVPTDSKSSFSARVTRLALFAQDEWNLTPLWSLYLGGRWEGIQTRTEGDTFTGATSRTSVFSPLMQTLYKLPGGKGDQLRFALTRTYKAPPVFRLNPRRFLSANNSLSEPDYGGNPDLKPELALGLDASYEHYWAEGALLSVSVSSRQIDNYMRDGIAFDGARYVYMPLNVGKAETRGLELEAKFPLKAVMQDAPPIDLRVSLSRNWSSVASIPGPNNRLSEQTPLSATVAIDYKKDALSAGASFAFRNGGAVRVTAEQISYVTVRRDLDAYVMWKFDPKRQFRLSASNMLGQGGVSENTYLRAASTTHRYTEYPGPAMIRGSYELKF